MTADSTGGFVRITALNDGECVPPAWELHWLDFNVAGGRRVRIYHATNKTNPAARYTIYQDPDTGQWTSWEPAQ